MKVLAIASEFDRCEANMLSRLYSLGVQITTVMEKKQRYGDVLASAHVPSIELSCRGRVDPRAIFKLRSIIQEGAFDVVHAFSSRGLSNILLAAVGLKVSIVAYRGTMGHLSWFDPTSWLSYLNPRLNKIICVSHAVERYLSGMGIPDRKLITIHKGHDLSWYDVQSDVNLSEFGIPSDAFVVSCVANMRPVKGVDVLSKATGELPHPTPIHLLLIGEVRDDRIRRLWANSPLKDQIHFTGFRNDAPSVVGRCQAFAMPSIKREGLPKALIEAMAKAVPPIVTNVGGMPEIVRRGVEGLVVPPSDPKALADAMISLSRDISLCLRFSVASRMRIRGDFNIARTTEKTFDVYKELSRTQK